MTCLLTPCALGKAAHAAEVSTETSLHYYYDPRGVKPSRYTLMKSGLPPSRFAMLTLGTQALGKKLSRQNMHALYLRRSRAVA